MIVIRPEQLAELTDVGVQSFAVTLAAALRQEGNGARLSEAELLRTVAKGVLEALRLGLSSEAQIDRFVVCWLRHGEGFPHAQAWARSLVDDASLTPVQVLERFEARDPGARDA